MSNKKLKKKLENAAKAQSEREAGSDQKVLMRFSEHKYYNDLGKPIFEAGKIYELEGANWIRRWLNRGGIIVDSADKVAEPEPQNPIKTVEDLAPPSAEADSEEESGEAEHDLGEDAEFEVEV